MATYDMTLGAEAGGHAATNRFPYLMENTINVGLINSSAGVAASDVLQAIAVPKETLILAAGLEVLTAFTSDGTPTLDLDGAGQAANGWAAALDSTSAGYSTAVSPSATNQRVMVTATTGDTIDITVNTAAATAGLVRIWAVLLDVSGHRETATNT